jgi:hypothetical protein
MTGLHELHSEAEGMVDHILEALSHVLIIFMKKETLKTLWEEVVSTVANGD